MPRPIALFVDRGFAMAPIAAALGPEVDCREAVGPEDHADVVAIVTGAVPIGADDVAPYPGLRLVLTCTIGTDHLDLEALAARGLTVANTPTYCTQEVADHALAAVLSGWRGLGRLGAATKAGQWDWGSAGVLRRFDASRLGIVGLGRIGRALAASAQALGIDVVAHDPFLDAAGAPVPLLALDELLATSHAVSLHLPGDPSKPPLIGADELARLPQDAVLVNLARPGLCDLDAVCAALASGRLRAAIWDVWPDEPPRAGDARLQTPGLEVTPHAGWYSEQADQAYRDEAVAVLRDVLVEGREPASRVA
jgi:D-3-phosphoglycerate dehydrogenase / 2-oxoglutarate reductase